MRTTSLPALLMWVWAFQVVATGTPLSYYTVSTNTNTGNTESFDGYSDLSNGNDIGSEVVDTLQTYGDFINPEDIQMMPQCIAQQDQSIWLDAMTRCTSKHCIRHFGIICSRHQWLTQLSCLGNELSPDLINGYLAYCGRSVLAKAQLYSWMHATTGRTWLVEVGDANGLEQLSPASLADGYAAIDVIDRAPRCLKDSSSAPSNEPFQHIVASCEFPSKTQQNGNVARPWEYNEGLRSMTSLGFETVGYDLTGRNINYGHYFDIDCFCRTYILNWEEEPCANPDHIDLTRERLWMHTTCGPASLPNGWKQSLRITGFEFVLFKDWHQPKCFSVMPNWVWKQTNQCTTDACTPDSSGYCNVERVIDRTCFCRNIDYDSCGSLCQDFHIRIGYVNWLHDTCGNVQDWHGLPSTWRKLAAPTALDMIPWRWKLKADDGITNQPQMCASNDWKLGNIALMNVIPCLAIILGWSTGIGENTLTFPWHGHPYNWILTGIFIAGLQFFATWINAILAQANPGYESVPISQLLLLWSSVPRPSWFPILLYGVQSFGATQMTAAKTWLIAELILQTFSSYYMMITVVYGLVNGFYTGSIQYAKGRGSAELMYSGALMWFAILGLSLALICFSTLDPNGYKHAPARTISVSAQYERTRRTNLTTRGNVGRTRFSETERLLRNERVRYAEYGTTPVRDKNEEKTHSTFADWHTITVIVMFLLWVAQSFFWSGFIGLSSDEYCPPQLGVLAAVWIVGFVVSALVGTTR